MRACRNLLTAPYLCEARPQHHERLGLAGAFQSRVGGTRTVHRPLQGAAMATAQALLMRVIPLSASRDTYQMRLPTLPSLVKVHAPQCNDAAQHASGQICFIASDCGSGPFPPSTSRCLAQLLHTPPRRNEFRVQHGSSSDPNLHQCTSSSVPLPPPHLVSSPCRHCSVRISTRRLLGLQTIPESDGARLHFSWCHFKGRWPRAGAGRARLGWSARHHCCAQSTLR